VGPRAGLDDVEKRKFLTLPGLELRPLGRQVRSQSLYRLRHPGSIERWIFYIYDKDIIEFILASATVLERRGVQSDMFYSLCLNYQIRVCNKQSEGRMYLR
jgi:hypothetical protein